jgi:hypothetical protein
MYCSAKEKQSRAIRLRGQQYKCLASNCTFEGI